MWSEEDEARVRRARGRRRIRSGRVALPRSPDLVELRGEDEVALGQPVDLVGPDPRDDLSGMDVARKLTILARELGQPIEIGDFPVQNLIPESLRDASVDEFLERLSDYDDDMLALYEAQIVMKIKEHKMRNKGIQA